ncbi:hypothetical protein JOE59_000293 [Agromyces cerinus]|uniref:Imm61 family immunity protein n=1 Tax=Agromyces cerinus TaxID=33878 RepID=UPI00195838B7|nr:Imm61 family immunity protein [Agromyces cerinus]MBM7829588.1 hypothetical protein [Agromyces cerinus]
MNSPDRSVAAVETRLIEFAEWHGDMTFPLEEGEVLSLGNMETLYLVTKGVDERFHVGSEDRGRLREMIRADQYLDALTFLAFEMAATVRSERGLPLLRVLSQPEDGADGFAVDVAPGEVQVAWGTPEDRHLVVFNRATADEALMFTHYADASPDEIIDSLLHPAGRPLFAGMMAGQRG